MKSLSLIGMSKNAGKTTALNAILRGFFHSDTVLGLTSIGRDGEDLDIVTNTEKPRIYIKEGTVFATAAGLLSACDVTKEVLMTTGVNTPLGEVIVLRALTGGYVQLAGPSINAQITALCEVFRGFGAELVIVDGAFSRKTLASPAVTEATILCTGASYSRNIRRVVDATWHMHDLLKSAPVEPAMDALTAGFPLAAVDEQGRVQGFEQAALTDTLANNLIKQGYRGGAIVAEDASKFLIGVETHKKLALRGIETRVRAATQLIAVTVNPVSAYGYAFDAAVFKDMLRQQIQTPVINVVEEGAALYDLLV